MYNVILDVHCVKYSVLSCCVVMCHCRCSLRLLHKWMLEDVHDLTTSHTITKLQVDLDCSLI